MENKFEIEFLNLVNTLDADGLMTCLTDSDGPILNKQQIGSLLTAKGKLPNRKFEKLSQLLTAGGVSNDQGLRIERAAQELLAWVPNNAPALLFPLRLETRFKGNTLWIRIFPDDALIDKHDPRLSPEEIRDGRSFVKLSSDAKNHDDLKSAWRALATTYGPARAAWIAEACTADKAIESVRSEKLFSRAALPTLPYRFLAKATRPNGESILAFGKPVKRELSLLEADPFGPAKWLSNLREAEVAGMAIRIPLAAQDIEAVKKGAAGAPVFQQLIVVGLQAGQPDNGKKTEALLQSHAYADGIAVLEYGTRTNNTQDEKSEHSESREDIESRFSLEFESQVPLHPEKSAGALLATALGAGDAVFKKTAGARSTADCVAGAMRKVLWPSTGDYFLRHALRGMVSKAGLDSLAHHFVEHVHAAGSLAAIRLGNQPYGVIPVCNTRPNSRYGWKPWISKVGDGTTIEFDAALLHTLDTLRKTWSAYAADPVRVPRTGFTEDPYTELLTILAMEPYSTEERTRLFVDRGFVAWLLIAMREDLFGAGLPFQQKLSDTTFWAKNWHDQVSLERAKRSTTCANLTGATAKQFAETPWLNGFPWDEDAVREVQPYAEADLQDLPKELTKQLALLSLQKAKGVPPMLVELLVRSHKLISRLDKQSPISAEEFLNAVSRVAAHCRALSHRPNVETLFRLTLDLCSHRLDAWLSSFAAKRLKALRQKSPKDTYLGAYGYVENLSASPEEQSSAGFVHAPSLQQATTAAVFHSAYLNHDGQGNNPARINLSSERTRKALQLVDGVRNGQPLGALLGYEFERRLVEAGVAQYIDDFRAAFPISAIAESNNNDQPVEAIAARNVVDGLAIARHAIEKEPHSTIGLVVPAGTSDIEANILSREVDNLTACLDALTDLMMFESIHHAAQGNFEAAAAPMDALAGAGTMPEIRGMDTPVSANSYLQRTLLLFPATDATPVYQPSSPRACVEARIAFWFANLLGDLTKIGIRFQFEHRRVNVNTASRDELLAAGMSNDEADKVLASARPCFSRLDHLASSGVVSGDHLALLRRTLTTGRNTLSLRELIQDEFFTELRLDQVDLLYLSAVSPRSQEVRDDTSELLPAACTEIEQRIAYWVRREFGLYADERVEISLVKPADDHYTWGLGDVLELGRQVLAMLTVGAPLKPSSLATPAQAGSATFDPKPLSNAREKINKLIAREQQLRADDEWIAWFFDTSRFGVSVATLSCPILASKERDARRKAVLASLTKQAKESLAELPVEKVSAFCDESLVGSYVKAISKLFGGAVVATPEWLVTPDASSAFRSSVDSTSQQRDLVVGLGEERVRLWLQQAAVAQPSILELEDALITSELWLSAHERPDSHPAAIQLRVAQLPPSDPLSADSWLALSDVERKGAPRPSTQGSVSIVSAIAGAGLAMEPCSADGELTGYKVAGLALAEWHEHIPSDTVTTGISLHYNGPSNQAPQCLLLAVPGQPDKRTHWHIEELADIVSDAMDLAKIRLVDPDAMGEPLQGEKPKTGSGLLFPGLVFPIDPDASYTDPAASKQVLDWLSAKPSPDPKPPKPKPRDGGGRHP